MKRIFEYLDRHGATHWVRVRIPKDLKGAYPAGQAEVLDNRHTGDPAEAKTRSYAVIARIRAEFAQKRGERTLAHASLSLAQTHRVPHGGGDQAGRRLLPALSARTGSGAPPGGPGRSGVR